MLVYSYTQCLNRQQLQLMLSICLQLPFIYTEDCQPTLLANLYRTNLSASANFYYLIELLQPKNCLMSRQFACLSISNMTNAANTNITWILHVTCMPLSVSLILYTKMKHRRNSMPLSLYVGARLGS